MSLVLLQVKEGIEIIAMGEITLRRPARHWLIALVTNAAGSQRLGCELLNMTIDASPMSRKLKFQPFVS